MTFVVMNSANHLRTHLQCSHAFTWSLSLYIESQCSWFLPNSFVSNCNSKRKGFNIVHGQGCPMVENDLLYQVSGLPIPAISTSSALSSLKPPKKCSLSSSSSQYGGKPAYLLIQFSTTLCQTKLFSGFRTQWFSS
jgi:hypothetical protein